MGAQKIYVVGVGPGDGSLITLRAAELIAQADYVAGFRSTLGLVEHLTRGKRVVVLDYRNQEVEVGRLLGLAKQGYRCVVCAHGDPYVSDSQFTERFAGDVEVEVVPGVSSVQALCARLRLPLEHTVFITLHKAGPIDREKWELAEYARMGVRHLVVFPRPWDFMPQQIARFLLEAGVGSERHVEVAQRLTLPGEKIVGFTLGELACSREEFSDLTILVVAPR